MIWLEIRNPLIVLALWIIGHSSKEDQINPQGIASGYPIGSIT
jgi:hypothetical protein